jgi:hypothetical protein
MRAMLGWRHPLAQRRSAKRGVPLTECAGVLMRELLTEFARECAHECSGVLRREHAGVSSRSGTAVACCSVCQYVALHVCICDTLYFLHVHIHKNEDTCADLYHV